MTLDPAPYRAEFPLVQASTYLNHAAVSPISRRVSNAITGLLEDVQLYGARHFDEWIERVESARLSAARLLNADSQEIAFVPNTSAAISVFANALEWETGSEVVSVEGEFPTNYYPWKALERKGVRLRLVPQSGGEVRLDLIAGALTSRTKVVAISFVQFLSGYRSDLNELGKLCADRGLLLFVDAIQGWGAFPIDVKAAKISGLAASGHKWLLGPGGCGVLFVKKDLAEQLQPSIVGWLSVEGWHDFTAREPVWRTGAGRFESGTPNLAGIYGLGAAFELLSGIGMELIKERVLGLTDRLRRGLAQSGYRIYGPTAGEACSGIVTFLPRDGESADTLVKRFNDHSVFVSVRSGMVRVSPHFYNTEAEVDRVLELLS
jgi:cysteine desulfurase / selenocysteine lyase